MQDLSQVSVCMCFSPVRDAHELVKKKNITTFQIMCVQCTVHLSMYVCICIAVNVVYWINRINHISVICL